MTRDDNSTKDPRSIPHLIDVLFESFSDKCGYKTYTRSADVQIDLFAEPKYLCLKKPGPYLCNVDECPDTK